MSLFEDHPPPCISVDGHHWELVERSPEPLFVCQICGARHAAQNHPPIVAENVTTLRRHAPRR